MTNRLNAAWPGNLRSNILNSNMLNTVCIFRRIVVHGCLVVISAGLGCLAGCDSAPQATRKTEFRGDYPIKATVTVGMVADLVRLIGGDHVQVTQLMGAGVDPHLYKPSRDDVSAIISADIVFYNGLMLEGKMGETLARASRDLRCFAAAEALPPAELGIDPEQHAHPDPHVWMSVELWRQAAVGIAAELSAFDPSHAAEYASALAGLEQRLRQLHAYGVEMMACVPEQQRVLVTSHDAFRYFGKAYGIEVQAIQGISTESEAGLNRINELVDMLVTRKIASVFIESSVPEDSIEALLRGAKSRGHEVRIAGSLYSDAMGAKNTYEGTYIGMMDHNLSTIARELGCTKVPAGGFRESTSP